ncbi:MAG: hypothetical protein WD065_07400 [Planctomycetaceae bacterium]
MKPTIDHRFDKKRAPCAASGSTPSMRIARGKDETRFYFLAHVMAFLMKLSMTTIECVAHRALGERRRTSRIDLRIHLSSRAASETTLKNPAQILRNRAKNSCRNLRNA